MEAVSFLKWLRFLFRRGGVHNHQKGNETFPIWGGGGITKVGKVKIEIAKYHDSYILLKDFKHRFSVKGLTSCHLCLLSFGRGGVGDIAVCGCLRIMVFCIFYFN